jgi:adenylate kinase family enzyme
LSHVLWIGGATDAGKTTLSEIIAKQFNFHLYHHDRHDLVHHEHLAQNSMDYCAFLTASMDERWIVPSPEKLFQRAIRSFHDRFPLVIKDLLALPKKPGIMAEGFGLLPELLVPVLSSKRQAIWLVPTESFKWASMRRRNKPSFREQTSDPEKATRNLLIRDMLLAEYVKTQTQLYGLQLYEVDGSCSIEEMVTLLKQHFEPILS